jgi:hypothetical protein
MPKQAKYLTEKQFYNLFDEVVPRKDWFKYHHKKVTIGKLLEIIRKRYHVEVSSSEKSWTVQLFDLEFCTREEIHSNVDKHLIDALFLTLIWILNERKTS